MRRNRWIIKVATIFASLIVLLAPLVVAGLFAWQATGPSRGVTSLDGRVVLDVTRK
jgi:hypothetical protein